MLSSRSSIKILNRSEPNSELWGIPQVTNPPSGCNAIHHHSPGWPSRQFITQRRIYLSQPQEASSPIMISYLMEDTKTRKKLTKNLKHVTLAPKFASKDIHKTQLKKKSKSSGFFCLLDSAKAFGKKTYLCYDFKCGNNLHIHYDLFSIPRYQKCFPMVRISFSA